MARNTIILIILLLFNYIIYLYSFITSSNYNILIYNSNYHISLSNNTLNQVKDLCTKLSNNINNINNINECYSLSLQTIRTLRLFYIQNIIEKTTNLINDKYSLLLSYSYAIETCPIYNKDIQINICLFGNYIEHFLFLILLSCPLYKIKIYNNYNVINLDFLTQIRKIFPNRSIQWIPGNYTSYYSPPNNPVCNIIYMDSHTLGEFSSRNFPPIPTPITDFDSSSSSLLYPCGGKGLIVTNVPIDDHNTHLNENYQLLSNNYLKYGYSLDWKMHSITDTYTQDRSIEDSEGFFYRLTERYLDSPMTRISYGCVNSLQHDQNKVNISSQQIDLTSILPLSTQSILSLSSCPDIVITFTNRVFMETAIGIKEVIEKLNLPNIIVTIWFDMNLALLNIHCPSPLQIAIAPHEETPLLTNYIVYQMEQTWSDYFKHSRYFSILREAKGVWTFSNQQILSLSNIGVDISNIWIVPLYIDNKYSQNTITLYEKNEIENLDIKNDLLFLGSFSERRIKFINDLTHNASLINRSIKIGGVLGGAKELLFGDKRDNSVRNSKYSPAVVFAEYENILPSILFLLDNDDVRKSIKMSSVLFVKELLSDVSIIEKSLRKYLDN